MREIQAEDVPACAAAYLKLFLDAHSRGFGKDLTIDVTLSEDGRTVVLMANVEDDEPPMASYMLTQPTTEKTFYA